MMRRLLLSSAKPHQPHYHHHHHHHQQQQQHDHQRNKSNRSPDTERQRRLYSAAKVSPNTPVRSSVQQQVQGKQSYRVSKGGIMRRGRSLARTRSESDLIRAMAKKANKKNAFSSDSSDDESDDDSSSSEDESQRATSLRSFTKEDEERYALASWNNAFPGEVCSKIGEEDEQSATLKSTSHHEQEAEDATEDNPTPTCSGSSSTKLTTVSPLSDSSGVSVQQPQPQLKTANSPTVGSSLKDEETKTHSGSESGNESTSATTELVGSDVDVEYLLHENDLLKNSLEHVTQDRDYLAQDNWNLRMELENLRNQMRFLMTPSVSQYNARVMYPTGSSPPPYTTDASTSMNRRLSQHDSSYGGAYAQYSGPLCTQSFEDLMYETAR